MGRKSCYKASSTRIGDFVHLTPVSLIFPHPAFLTFLLSSRCPPFFSPMLSSPFCHPSFELRYTLKEYSSFAVAALSLPTSARLFADTKFSKKWNLGIQTLIGEDGGVKEILTRLYATQKELGYLYRLVEGSLGLIQTEMTRFLRCLLASTRACPSVGPNCFC